jgi:hypothetical protein
MLATEYGWTPDTIFNTLTRGQVEAYLGAMGRRYARQAQAMKTGDKPSDSHGSKDVTPEIEALLSSKEALHRNPALLKEFNIKVE